MKYFFTLLALVVCSTLFTNCKKGKDDPLISFHTRKSRLCSEWKMMYGSASFYYKRNAKPTYVESFSFSGPDLTVRVTENYQPTVYIGKYLLTLEFMKDGKFSLTETIKGTSVSTLRASGTWDFISGIGKAKNKEGIVLKIDDVTKGASDEHVFNRFGMELTYMITELRRKVLSLESHGQIYMTQDGNCTSYDSQFKFESVED